MPATDKPRRMRRMVLHGVRVALLLTIIILIHLQHTRLVSSQRTPPFAQVDLDLLRSFFPRAASVGDRTNGHGGRGVLDASGRSLGYILQTSPDSDRIIGFSGPTNVLIAFGADDRVLGIDILSSGDTRDHVQRVRDDKRFRRWFGGLTWEEAAGESGVDAVDAVSGATLTSLAIQESVIYRLSGGRPSLRFPDPLTPADARRLFADAARVEPDPAHPALWHVFDQHGSPVGMVLRTSPSADNIVGYQGPTDTWIGFDLDGRVTGIVLGKTYDNEQYVTYVRDDEYFPSLFQGLRLDELARLNLEEAEIEGVSGATMTSMAVAEGLVRASAELQKAQARAARPRAPRVSIRARDFGTAAVVFGSLLIGFTRLRSSRILRWLLLCLLVGYLGLVNGDMVSQAMLVGWAQNGVPWNSAVGLVLLTTAALLLPITTGRNTYCSHLCPHGAAQQLLKRRLPWTVRLPRWLSRVARRLPAALLTWCVIVAMTGLRFSLVDIEPFDAWVFRVAGGATITIAIVGLVASLFVPMAYCRYGCPTGGLLSYLRYHGRSDRWTRSDWLAVGLVAIAVGLWVC